MYTASRCGHGPRALMENADRIPIIAARCDRAMTGTEFFDPGILTICHHTIIALPIGTSARGGCRPSTRQQPTRSRGRGKLLL